MPAEIGAFIAGLFEAEGAAAIVGSGVGEYTSLATLGIESGASYGGYLAAASLGSTAYSASQQQKAGGAQRKALREQQRIADIKNQREIRDQVRQERIKRATILQSGENVGAAESSGAIGGAGSVTSQAAGNISFLDQLGAASRQSNIFQEKAVGFAENASLAKGIGNFASTFAGPEGYRKLGATIFNTVK